MGIGNYFLTLENYVWVAFSIVLFILYLTDFFFFFFLSSSMNSHESSLYESAISLRIF